LRRPSSSQSRAARPVLLGERHRQVEDVGAAAVGDAVPVEVRGCQPNVDHGVDLRAQLAVDVGLLAAAAFGLVVAKPELFGIPPR
jgi:hypothetical protein